MPVRFGPFEFDAVQRRLTRQGVAVHLTPLAFTLLDLLIREAPTVFTKQELHGRLWPDSFVSDASLTSLIKEIRRALDDREARVLIRTVNRVGYAFGAGGLQSPGPAAETVHWVEVHNRHVGLRPGRNVVGRSPDAEVRLEAAGVSRLHAAIEITGAAAVLSDLGSKNGTRLDGQLLTAPAPLADRDRIVLGDVTLMYRQAQGGLPTETLVNGAPDA